MSAKTTPELFLRSYLTDKQGNSGNAIKSLAFSPDIIPQYGNEVPPTTLIDEYKNFVSLSLQPNDTNNIYVRAMTTPNVTAPFSRALTMRAVPSELILWPQVWNQVTALAPGPLVIKGDSSDEVVAGAAPFTLRPSNLGGFSYTLIASQSAVPLDNKQNTNVRLRDVLQTLPPSIGNWRDYYKFLKTDTSTTYYNVIVADPTSPIISIATRLRIYEDDPSIQAVDLQFSIEVGGLPSDTEVSLSSDDGSINLERKMVGSGDFGVHASLSDGYDGIITMNIFPAEGSVLPSSSWISLQVLAIQSGGGGISTASLLGAQNVIFDADATRNLRFVSPAAVQLRKLHPSTVRAEALGTGTPAIGWWFRDQISDTNSYPRDGVFSHSPDIQGTGGQPDSNIVADIGGPTTQNVDYMDNHQVVVTAGSSNFFYLRGNCTLSNYQVQSRLFAVPCNVLLSPSTYYKWSVNDYDGHGNPSWAMRSLTTTQANGFNVYNNPFNLLDPPAPSTYGADHYCMISETRHPTTATPDPNWPHENTGDFATGADFNTWIGGTATVAWRNVTYSTADPGATKVMPTTMTIPPNIYPSNTMWTLTANAYNATPDSFWQLTGYGPAVPGVTIGFDKVQLGNRNATQGCHFTGLPFGGYQAGLVLQWWAGAGGIPNGLRFSFTLYSQTNAASPAYSLARPLPLGAEDWNFSVGKYHPGLPSTSNSRGRRALGHTFERIGPQPWPYAHKVREHRKRKLEKHRPEHGKGASQAGGTVVDVGVDPVQVFPIGGDTYYLNAAP